MAQGQRAIISEGEENRFLEFGLDHGLTRREAELGMYAYRHYSARKIGGLLHISEATVYTHLKHIYRKTGVHSREELAGLIDSWLARHS